MRIDTIRNSRICPPPTPKIKIKTSQFKTNAIPYDSVSFKSNAAKGAGIGAVCGLLAMGAISLLSGGLATPAAFGLYAAAGGAAGGFAGSAVDQSENHNGDK